MNQELKPIKDDFTGDIIADDSFTGGALWAGIDSLKAKLFFKIRNISDFYLIA